ncbi:hypothetical protein [Marinobacter mobilis]|uniref:hypothetical protein n=1 Tax=Marinobacter mobilis TaxID=488533 RepID=UPI0035C78897
MAKDRRARLTGKAGRSPFLGIPHHVIGSEAYKSLDGWAVKLLVDIAAQFKGNNNGDLCAAWSVMQDKGWNSKGTLHKALKALLDAGLIEQTRQGGRNRCSLYAITWRSIDECRGKLDVRPTNAPSSLYLKAVNEAA